MVGNQNGTLPDSSKRMSASNVEFVQVSGFPGNRYEGFATLSEAQRWQKQELKKKKLGDRKEEDLESDTVKLAEEGSEDEPYGASRGFPASAKDLEDAARVTNSVDPSLKYTMVSFSKSQIYSRSTLFIALFLHGCN